MCPMCPMCPTRVLVVDRFTHLRILDVGACHIPSWAVVADSFGKLEKLEELILDANPISEVYLNRVGDFATLRRISLGSTL